MTETLYCLSSEQQRPFLNCVSFFHLNLGNRLNSSYWLQGRLVALVKSSVSPGSFHYTRLSLSYSRSGWLPIYIVETSQLIINSVALQPPSIFDSNVPHKDTKVITIGEDITFQVKISLPVSTSLDFTLKVSGQDVEGVSGKIIHVGSNIHRQSSLGQIRGAGKDIIEFELVMYNKCVVNSFCKRLNRRQITCMCEKLRRLINE